MHVVQWLIRKREGKGGGVIQNGERSALECQSTEAAENEAKVAAGNWNDYLFDRLMTRKV